MKLSTKGRYAVMAVADLAKFVDDGPVALSDIASRQSISLSYLEQLFAKLRRADIVKSVRGPGGGYKLTHSAADTRISDVMRAVDEPLRTTRCSETKGCLADGRRCVTHDLWDELGRHIYLFLSSITLQDVLDRKVLGSASGANGMHEMLTEIEAVD